MFKLTIKNKQQNKEEKKTLKKNKCSTSSLLPVPSLVKLSVANLGRHLMKHKLDALSWCRQFISLVSCNKHSWGKPGLSENSLPSSRKLPGFVFSTRRASVVSCSMDDLPSVQVFLTTEKILSHAALEWGMGETGCRNVSCNRSCHHVQSKNPTRTQCSAQIVAPLLKNEVRGT